MIGAKTYSSECANNCTVTPLASPRRDTIFVRNRCGALLRRRYAWRSTAGHGTGHGSGRTAGNFNLRRTRAHSGIDTHDVAQRLIKDGHIHQRSKSARARSSPRGEIDRILSGDEGGARLNRKGNRSIHHSPASRSRRHRLHMTRQRHVIRMHVDMADLDWLSPSSHGISQAALHFHARRRRRRVSASVTHTLRLPPARWIPFVRAAYFRAGVLDA